MKDTVQDTLRALGNRQASDTEPIPDDISLMEIADRVVRGKLKLGQQQMRLLIELLPYQAPKLMAIASDTSGAGFAALLDRAIRRSEGMKLIEGTVNSEPINGNSVEHDPSELKGPMAKLERY
jgi:hypothetical protein